MTRKNFGEIAATLQAEFQATNPYSNPYIFQVQLPKGMGTKRLMKYLNPANGIDVSEEKLGRARYIYVDVDEFDAVVVDNTTPLSDYFNVKPWDALSCIKVKSLPGEFAQEEVHAVQNVNTKLYKIGDRVRVTKLYYNGTDYGARRVIG